MKTKATSDLHGTPLAKGRPIQRPRAVRIRRLSLTARTRYAYARQRPCTLQ